MRITSNEVQAVKFSVALRGYAADEVDAFLEIVVKTIAEYEGIHDRLQREVKRLREALDECRETRFAEGPAKARTVVTVQADEAVARVRGHDRRGRPDLGADGRDRAGGGRTPAGPIPRRDDTRRELGRFRPALTRMAVR